MPYPFQVSESFLLPFPDTVDDLQAHAVYPATLGKVSAQFTAHIHNLLPVTTVSLVHGLCRAASVLFATPQASHQVHTVGTFTSQVVPDLVLESCEVALEKFGFVESVAE